jgi:DNA-binding transcriptional ArsR family regulator
MVTTKARQSDAIFKAIADPTRREILGLLRTGGQSVGTIAANFRTSRPAISRHIRLLRRAGLVATQRRGAARICRLNARPLGGIDLWLRDYREFWTESLANLKKYVEENL